MPKPIDITGKRFGKLVAIRPTGNNIKGRGREWECKCDCGNIGYFYPTQLSSGSNVSCGCLNTNKADAKPKRYAALDDCVSFRQNRCDCLTEMFCVTRGKCRFYTPKERELND